MDFDGKVKENIDSYMFSSRLKIITRVMRGKFLITRGIWERQN